MERRAALPSGSRPRPTRRTALVVGAGTAAALAGCARGGVRAPLPPPTRQESVDERQRLLAVADERRLLAAYAATAARHPSLAALLAVPQAHHAQHLTRLAPPAATPSPTPSGVAAVVSGDPRAAVAALMSAELSAAAARRTGCAQASAVLAPLLASVGAAEAVHAALLDGGGP